MGGKYEVRYTGDDYCTEHHTNSFWEFLKLLWVHRGKIIYFRVFYD